MIDEPFIPEDSVTKDELPSKARFKCNICGAYYLNKRVECSGFGGDPGDDGNAHAMLLTIPNPDRTEY